jgi:phosphate/sulfate permease
MNLPLVGRLHWPSVIATIVFMWFVLPWLTGLFSGLTSKRTKKA